MMCLSKSYKESMEIVEKAKYMHGKLNGFYPYSNLNHSHTRTCAHITISHGPVMTLSLWFTFDAVTLIVKWFCLISVCPSNAWPEKLMARKSLSHKLKRFRNWRRLLFVRPISHRNRCGYFTLTAYAILSVRSCAVHSLTMAMRTARYANKD